MLDIRLLREEPDLVRQGLQAKGYDSLVVDHIAPLDSRARELQTQLEALRAERNKIASLGPHAAEQGRKIKQEIETVQELLTVTSGELRELLLGLPNLPATDVPVGEGESANKVVKTVGDLPIIEDPKDHLELAEKYDLIDMERAAKVSGSRFNYLKRELVLLEFALVRYALDKAQAQGFIPMITPELVNERTVMGTGYLPQGADEVYKTQDDLYLIGTSELALVAYHQDEVLAEKELPRRYVGFSSCFRREAGTYGKDMRGILRQHQFDKVELVSLVTPEESEAELERILALEEEIVQGLGLPYQVIKMGSGDLGVQAAKKYDIETWMPGQGKYRETHSCSNTTDFQARRLNIRYKTSQGKNEFVHTLNGTAVAIGRMLIAILENGQQKDGTIRLPQVLVPYIGIEMIGASS